MNRKHSVVTWMTCVMMLFLSTSVLADIKIKHKPVTKAKSSHRILLRAEVRDKESGIAEVRAYFKAASESRWYYVPMHEENARYVGVLPAPSLGVGQVSYMIYAVTGNGHFVKTQQYVVAIKDDEDALSRLEAKEPTDIELDLDKVDQLRELADEGGEPRPERRVEVRNDIPGSTNPTAISGFKDYIVLSNGIPAAAGAGVASAATVAASAGAGAGAVLGGLVVAGGLGAAASSASEDDDGGPSVAPSSSADGAVTSRNVVVTITDNNAVLDDVFGLFVNGSFVGTVRNPAGGSTRLSASLRGGANIIELRLVTRRGSGTRLRIAISPGGFSRQFTGSHNHRWVINAP